MGGPFSGRCQGTAAETEDYFFLVLFLPFLPRLFFRILMLQVRFQLTFAMRGLLAKLRVHPTPKRRCASAPLRDGSAEAAGPRRSTAAWLDK